MGDIIKFENLQDRIIEIRDETVLLDIDVADGMGWIEVEIFDFNNK